MWWSAEMHRRLTYSEWQSALPRMVRRWNDDCGHQLECDDDAASITSTAAASAVSEAEGRAGGTVRVALKRVRPLPPDRARSASEVLSGASPCRRTWLWWFIGGQCGHRQHCCQSAATVTRRRISTPWAPHARCDLVSACTGTAEQSCKIDSYADLSKLRTVDHDMYSKFVKVGRREIPEEIYPTCLERSGMG